MNEANTMEDVLGPAGKELDVPAGADWRGKDPGVLTEAHNAVECVPLADARCKALLDELRAVLNRHSVENASDTPDYLLAEYVSGCLDVYARTVKARDAWFGFQPWPNRAKGFAPNGEG